MTTKQRPSVFPVAAFAVCLILSGCATEQKQQTEVWLQDKPMVMQSVVQAQTRQQQIEQRIAVLEKRLAELETARLQQDAVLASAQEEITGMKGQIRSLQRAAAQLNASRKITKQKLDKKIESIAQAIKPAEPADQTINKEAEKDHYTAAYLALKSGRYEEAIEKFRDLLKTYPNGGYSDQAYYWLGESYLAQNNIERAVGNLDWFVGHYPESTKHAAGMLRLATAYQTQQRPDEAVAMLRRLIDQHADSPAAEEARNLLKSSSENPAK